MQVREYVDNADWDTIRLILPRIIGPPGDAKGALYDAIALLDDRWAGLGGRRGVWGVGWACQAPGCATTRRRRRRAWPHRTAVPARRQATMLHILRARRLSRTPSHPSPDPTPQSPRAVVQRAEDIAADVLESLASVDSPRKYFDAMPARAITGAQNAEFVKFSSGALNRSVAKISEFVALMPRDARDAAQRAFAAEQAAAAAPDE